MLLDSAKMTARKFAEIVLICRISLNNGFKTNESIEAWIQVGTTDCNDKFANFDTLNSAEKLHAVQWID